MRNKVKWNGEKRTKSDETIKIKYESKYPCLQIYKPMKLFPLQVVKLVYNLETRLMRRIRLI